MQGDFNNSFEKLNSGDAGASLAYLARAMRTNPDYAPAGMRAVSTLRKFFDPGAGSNRCIENSPLFTGAA